MDDLPYHFVDSVLTRLDGTDLPKIRDHFASPIWSEAARIHVKKRLILRLNVSLRSDGSILYGCYNHENDDEEFTFDAVLAMDLRFVRVGVFCICTDSWTDADVLVDRIDEIFSFVSMFCLQQFDIVVECPDVLQLLVEQLAKRPITAQCLVLEYLPGIEVILREQLAMGRVEQLVLEGLFPDDIRKDLEAFVYAPNCKDLRVEGETPVFEFETLERFIAYWKATPGKEADLWVPTNDRHKKEFSTLLPYARHVTPFFLECREETDLYLLTVVCCSRHTQLVFHWK